jgi:hypothetical protein
VVHDVVRKQRRNRRRIGPLKRIHHPPNDGLLGGAHAIRLSRHGTLTGPRPIRLSRAGTLNERPPFVRSASPVLAPSMNARRSPTAGQG